MKSKSTIFLFSAVLFFMISLIPHAFFAGMKMEKPPATKTAPAKTDQKAAAKPQLPPGMTEDEMKMFAEFIDSLDQETIDALTAIGEEIIKEADELGIDPFEYIELQAQMQKEFEEKGEKEKGKAPAEKPKIEKPAAPIVPTADAQTAQEVFNGIIKVIPVIIQKASSDIGLANEMLPFKYRLDDVVFYSTKLADDKMLKYIGDPAFAPLIENAKKLYKELVTLNDQFFVPEFSLEGETAYEILDVTRSASQKEIVDAYDKISKIADPDLLELQLIREGKNDQQIKQEIDKARTRFQAINDAYSTIRAKEESKFILDRILDAVAQAVDTNKVLEEAKKVLQKYEPDAAKLKQEQEKKEADARKKQDEFLKKRPITSRAFNMPLPSGKYKKSTGGAGARYGRGGGAGYKPSGVKKKPAVEKSKLAKTPKAEKKTTGKGKEKDKDKDKDKEKDEKKKKKLVEGAGEKAAGKGKEKGKETSKDVTEALGGIKRAFDDLKDFIKDDKIVKGSAETTEPGAPEGQGIYYFVTTPFPADEKAKDEIKKEFIKFMVELTGKFAKLTKDIKKVLDKTLKDKKEDQKQFKEEVVKLFKKFEESDEYISIQLLMSTLKAETPSIFRGQPPRQVGIVDEKKNFILKEMEKDVENPEPLIKVLRDTYKKAKETVFPKEDKKGKPGTPPPPPQHN